MYARPYSYVCLSSIYVFAPRSTIYAECIYANAYHTHIRTHTHAGSYAHVIAGTRNFFNLRTRVHVCVCEFLANESYILA